MFTKTVLTLSLILNLTISAKALGSGLSLDELLREAVNEQRQWAALKLILKGANPDVPDEQGITALQVATAYKMKPVLNLMIRRSQDVSQADVRGWNPLFYAILNGSKSTVKKLLKHGAEVNQREEITGMSPLEYALNIGHYEIVELLTRYDLYTDEQDVFQNTALMYASLHHNGDLIRLIDHLNFDVHFQNVNGETALHFAAQAQNLEAAGMLWAAGARDNIVDVRKNTADGYFNIFSNRIWQCMKGVIGERTVYAEPALISNVARNALYNCRRSK